MYKKILVAIDGSDNSLRAAAEAAKIARKEPEAVVDILHVAVPPKTAREILLEPSKEEQEKARKNKVEPVEKILNDQGVKHKTTLLIGEAAHTITSYANDNNFDLLVLGCRGLNAVQKLVLGGVSNSVVQKAHCPVLIVK